MAKSLDEIITTFTGTDNGQLGQNEQLAQLLNPMTDEAGGWLALAGVGDWVSLWILTLLVGLTVLRFYVPLDTKQVILETLPKPISCLCMEKQNITQQKHAFTDQNKCTITQNRHKKLKPGFVASYNIRPGNRQGLFWFRCFINMSPTYLPGQLSLSSLRGR